MHRVTLINGDGIGPEISESVMKIIDAAGLKIDWDIQTAGADVIQTEGTPLPQRVLDSVRQNKVALKAPVTTPIGKGFRSVNVQLRKNLDLFANIRPCKNLTGVKTRFDNVNLVVVRENTEDLYACVEEKIDYLQIKTREILVDNLCMQLVQDPTKFDVLVLPNLYGDIVSDLTAGLIGGLGVAQGANVGNDCAVFEPVHGSAPDIKGQNKANPTALILSAVEMLRYINENSYAEKIEHALFKTLANGDKTQDLGGNLSTTDFTSKIIENL